MIGPMSSSLSLAQRTATKARATMDTMARQIATGQRVSSVKDDGAAWSRASAIQSSAIADRDAASAIARIDIRNTAALAGYESFLDGLQRVDSILLRALGAQSTTERAALQAELLAERETLQTIGPNAALIGGSALSYGPSGNIFMQAGQSMTGYDETGFSTAFGSVYTRAASLDRFEALDLNSANATQISASKTELSSVVSAFVGFTSQIGRNLAGHDRLAETASDRHDEKTALAASLTDADLGAASTARAQADTRQQLALDTIRTALTAYGNFAGGLLGNVQRTQRGVMA
jgi:flagellin-like hook-associated protein FlgL